MTDQLRHQDTPVGFETVTVRSALAPHWWQIIRRWRLRRWQRQIERDYNALPPEARASVDVMQRRVDHAMFFGEDRL